ncbi:actin-binding protein IPP isoform X1 [Schistocerca americana]|uniref:actin-binding protein IPP n=2 Tax=Schistocerca TaxID=7008 RepID=UPI001F4FC2B0|nr:actin-binding protein IPP isoform X1 [Schistocerca americana]XP_047113859.1 actin-binding protein IPP [Schistocerca piceifrons]XP_049858463.1 actin-binding protein IPP [Schistocerca gregaria]XP_049956695.1 actin-binding protein IPP [Schistocerca serialis cubense]
MSCVWYCYATMPPLKSSKPNDLTAGSSSQIHLKVSPFENNASQDMPNTNKYHCSNDYAKKVLLNLNFLRQNSRFCDISIVAGGKVLKAHRAVLSASSPYFQAMFTAGLSEEQQETIELHDVSPNILHTLIDFIYTGDVSIGQENVQELMAAADMLQLREVVQGCTDFLKRELHTSNAVGIYRFAEGHSFEELTRFAVDFIQCHFPQVCCEEEFAELPKEDLIKFLSSELLRVDTEFQVFQAAMRWIMHDVVQRRCYVFEILSKVRLPLLSLCLLDRAISECTDSSLEVALRSIRKDLMTKRGSLVPLNVQPRMCAKKDIYVIGGSKRELEVSWTRSSECTFNSVAKFNTFLQQWELAASMGISRILPGVTTLNGHIFAVGGEQDSQILANGEVYNPADNSWSKIASMVVPRCEFGLCALDGHLYALGGWVGEDIGDSIERYDPMQNEWQLEGNLPEARFSMGVVSYEGLIYMVGGCTHRSRHGRELYSYNPVTKEWANLRPMSVPRSQMGVAVLNDHLYIVGGTNRHNEVLQSVEKYSFQENKWTVVPPMRVGRATPAVAAADGLLYVIGGDQLHEVHFYRAQFSITSVECYDPLSDTWRNCSPLPESRSEAGAVVL